MLGFKIVEYPKTRGPADTYTDRSLYDRCITRGYPGSMLPAIYGNRYEIVQAPGMVAIRYEMIHETRVIPLDGRPHVSSRPSGMDMGDCARPVGGRHARGRDPTNFKERSVYRNANADTLKITERFTPRRADTLRWTVTVTTPSPGRGRGRSRCR